jgi:hypothetical protein
MKFAATEVACPNGVTDRDRGLAAIKNNVEIATGCVFRVSLSACEADVGREYA